MNYILKQYDESLLIFSADVNKSDPNIKIIEINKANSNLFPLDLELSEDGLYKWIKRRTIPKNRAYVESLLSKSGLSINRPLSIMSVCKCLSLNDAYWIVEENSKDKFSDVNLYDNKISRILSEIAFVGYGSSPKNYISSSPEFTTNGMLPKGWRRINGKIYLYKGATSGFSNTGFEPYSEYYAYQIAKVMGITAVEYGLSKWKGVLCSTCELFTSKDISFIPVGHIVETGGFEVIVDYYKKLGRKYFEALIEMMLYDAIIFNTDRHYGNFGFLINNKNNKIIETAPLFDHGDSLFSLAPKDSFNNEKLMNQYADSLLPCVYDNYLDVKPLLTNKHKEQLRKLLDFKFKRNKRYPIDENRLNMIEKQIKRRVQLILK